MLRKHLVFLVLLAGVVRLYKIDTPLADWHSFRQADTASVTREYVKHGVDLLHPRYHDLSNIQSGILTGGKDNLDGYRMVEFPIVNAVIATLLRIFPQLDLVITSRIFSILASLVTLVSIVLLATKLFGKTAGIGAGVLFGFLPYSVFYSRVILPEPYLIASATSSLVLFTYYNERKKIPYLVFSMVLFSLALLIKPMAIFFLPAFVGIALWKRKFSGLFDVTVLILGILAILPVYAWRQWITQYPTGIPWSSWLYNLDGIRLRPAWWRWLFWERLTKLFLGYTGILFFIQAGIQVFLQIWKKRSTFSFLFLPEIVLLLWGIGMFAYLIVFATGNVRHDYYQVLILPFLSIFVGYGLSSLWKTRQTFLRIAVVVLCGLTLLFSWQKIKGYYQVNHWEIIEAGIEADRILPSDAKVIAPYNGDTAFLFQTNRTGWPIGFDIDKKIGNGAQYYISVNYDDEARDLEKKYVTKKKTQKYIILDLTQKL